MRNNFRVFGWVLLTLGIVALLWLAVVIAVQVAIYMGMRAMMAPLSSPSPFGPGVPPMPSPISPFSPAMMGMSTVPLIILGLGVIVLILHIVAGGAILKRQVWAREVTILVSILALPLPPFWTAAGVIGLWLMCSTDGREGWEEYIHGRRVVVPEPDRSTPITQAPHA